MNVFGIQMTSGHIIVMVFGIIVWDAFWTWIVNNNTSSWWFERLQTLLKLGIYAGLVGVVALVAYTPWPVNLIIALSAALSIISIAFWLKRRR